MLVKQTDSNADGALNLSDFMKLMLPNEYTTFDNVKSAKRNYLYAQRPSRMTHEIEYGVTQILQRYVVLNGLINLMCREIEAIKKVEKLKQRLLNCFDYSALSIFRTID